MANTLFVSAFTKDPTMPAPESFGAQRRRLVIVSFGSAVGGADNGTFRIVGSEQTLEDYVGFRTITRVECVGATRRADLTPPIPIDADVWVDFRREMITTPGQEALQPPPAIYISNSSAGITYNAYFMVYGF